MNWDEEYLELVEEVLRTGEHNETRNGPTLSVFGTTVECRELEDGLFPILTTRRMYPEGIFGELAAFVRGATSLDMFKLFGCNYWDENAKAWIANKNKAPHALNVGKIYGAQWRDFNGVDQLSELIDGLKSDPASRRHVLTAYNPAEVTLGCLPPCHLLAQYSVRRGGYLESCVYMRSVDLCIGLPTDMVLYATLQILLAHEVGLYPGAITFMLGDAHIYKNHIDMLMPQLDRIPFNPPTYSLDPETELLSFDPVNLKLEGYTYHDKIDYAFNV